MDVPKLLGRELHKLEEMASKSKYPDAYTEYMDKLNAEIIRLTAIPANLFFDNDDSGCNHVSE